MLSFGKHAIATCLSLVSRASSILKIAKETYGISMSLGDLFSLMTVNRSLLHHSRAP